MENNDRKELLIMSKRDIILSKNHQITGTKDESTNVFVYNSHSARFNVDWLVRNILINDGIFIIQDKDSVLSESVNRVLDKKNYFTINIDCATPSASLHINPFDFMQDTADIHLMFTNFLFALWDNADPDIKAMSYLIDAFASSVFYMFAKNKEKQNLRTMVNMAKSINAYCTINDKSVPMYEALFTDNPNPDWMPRKYYMQFAEAAGENKDAVANKVYQLLQSIPADMLSMCDSTDTTLAASLYFKTAFVINSNTEDEFKYSKIILALLISLVENTEMHAPALVVLSQLDGVNLQMGLPRWMQNGVKNNIDYIVFANELQSFLSSELSKQYLTNMKKYVRATMMIQRNKEVEKAESTLSDEELQTYHSSEYVATLNIPKQNISIDDEVF